MRHHTAFSNNQKMVSELFIKNKDKSGNAQAHGSRGPASKDQNKSELPAYE